MFREKFIVFGAGLFWHKGFPGVSGVKNLPANAGDMDLIPGSGRFLGEKEKCSSLSCI